MPTKDLTYIGLAAIAGLLAGFLLGRSSLTERIMDDSDKNSFDIKYGNAHTAELLERLRATHDRLENKLLEMDSEVMSEEKLAIERKARMDRPGSLEALFRRRNLKKEMVRLQGMITTLFQNIMRLEAKESQDQVAITMGEAELARIMQIEDIEGDIVDYRVINHLSLMPRPPTSKHRVLNRSFSAC